VFGLPRRASLLWLLVVGCATATLLACGLTATWSPWTAAVAALFAVAGAIADRFIVPVPTSRPGHKTDLSVAAAITIAGLLVLPLPWAVGAASLAWVFGRRTVWFKRVYNIAQTTLSIGLGALIWHLAPSGASLVDPRNVPFVVLASVSAAVVQSLLVAAIVAFASGLPIVLTWLRTYRHTWPAALGIVFIGVLLAVLWTVSAWTIALAAIPLTALYYALRNTVSLETNTVDALFQLADILDARDAYTHGHSVRVGQYAEQLALELGLSGDEAHMILLAGRLHDIGKCAIKNEVLLKPGALDEEERAHMCIHPAVGGSMLESFALFRECARYVRGHHERWDGQGYPDKLQGEAIPVGARIIAVADAFDAMTTTRPYRKALPVAEARRRLADGAASQWDPRIIDAFLRLLETTSLGQPAPMPLPLPIALPEADASRAA